MTEPVKCKCGFERDEHYDGTQCPHPTRPDSWLSNPFAVFTPAEPSPAVPQNDEMAERIHDVMSASVQSIGVQAFYGKAPAVPESQTGPITDVPYEQHEREVLDVVTQRDLAEEAVGEAYLAVVGCAPEWSNCFGFDDAVNEISEIHRNEKEKRLVAEASVAELDLVLRRVRDDMQAHRCGWKWLDDYIAARATGKES